MTDKEIADTILNEFDNVNMDFQVAAYIELMKKIEVDGGISPFARCAYETYYGMTQAHLKPEWKNRYFEVLDGYLREPDNKVKKTLNLEMLMNGVGPCDDRNQPSFVSKLLHTVNDNEPIYDLHVRNFLKAGDPSRRDSEDLKESALKIYKKIRAFHETDVKYEHLRILMVETFDGWFDEKCRDFKSEIGRYVGVDNAYHIFETKKQDFVCWALGKKGHKITEFMPK